MKREDRVENLFLSTQSMIRGWRNYFQKSMGTEKLSPTLMTMLFCISSNQPISGRKIAEQLQLSPSATSQLIDGLANLGYITRETRSQDRRVTFFGLTKTGNEKAAQLENTRMKHFMFITEALTDEELETMVRLQQKVIDKVKNQIQEDKEIVSGRIK
jgi:DNA-binding MarR family transcriptional regulator